MSTNTMIDLTKKYTTRHGREVRNLRRDEGAIDSYVLIGDVYAPTDNHWEEDETWTEDGKFIWSKTDECEYDLVLAPNQEPARPGLVFPDPVLVEYGRFVAAVRASFAAGAFASATQAEFDVWLAELTPSFWKP